MHNEPEPQPEQQNTDATAYGLEHARSESLLRAVHEEEHRAEPGGDADDRAATERDRGRRREHDPAGAEERGRGCRPGRDQGRIHGGDRETERQATEATLARRFAHGRLLATSAAAQEHYT